MEFINPFALVKSVHVADPLEKLVFETEYVALKQLKYVGAVETPKISVVVGVPLIAMPAVGHAMLPSLMDTNDSVPEA